MERKYKKYNLNYICIYNKNHFDKYTCQEIKDKDWNINKTIIILKIIIKH